MRRRAQDSQFYIQLSSLSVLYVLPAVFCGSAVHLFKTHTASLCFVLEFSVQHYLSFHHIIRLIVSPKDSSHLLSDLLFNTTLYCYLSTHTYTCSSHHCTPKIGQTNKQTANHEDRLMLQEINTRHFHLSSTLTCLIFKYAKLYIHVLISIHIDTKQRYISIYTWQANWQESLMKPYHSIFYFHFLKIVYR